MAFHGKIVLITGGASGIGKVHATQLAGGGAKVVIFDLDEKGLEEISSESANISPFKCDVSKFEEVIRIFTSIKK